MTGAEEAPWSSSGHGGHRQDLLPLAVGLHALLETETPTYRRILISWPNVHFDDDIGFLPRGRGGEDRPSSGR